MQSYQFSTLEYLKAHQLKQSSEILQLSHMRWKLMSCCSLDMLNCLLPLQSLGCSLSTQWLPKCKLNSIWSLLPFTVDLCFKTMLGHWIMQRKATASSVAEWLQLIQESASMLFVNKSSVQMAINEFFRAYGRIKGVFSTNLFSPASFWHDFERNKKTSPI